MITLISSIKLLLIRLEIAGSWGRGLISILIRNFTFSAAWPLAVNSVGALVRVQVPPNQTCWLPKGHGAPLPSRGLPLQPAWSWRITAKQQMRSIPAGRPTRLPPPAEAALAGSQLPLGQVGDKEEAVREELQWVTWCHHPRAPPPPGGHLSVMSRGTQGGASLTTFTGGAVADLCSPSVTLQTPPGSSEGPGDPRVLGSLKAPSRGRAFRAPCLTPSLR